MTPAEQLAARVLLIAARAALLAEDERIATARAALATVKTDDSKRILGEGDTDGTE